MLVSVLMSVYNEESCYIRESIKSVLNQTYKDFEFIIVGDSPKQDRDRIFGIIQEFARIDKRIVFVPNESNIGLTRSLNVGLRHCSGKYIARMDADDVSVPTRLESQICFMEKNEYILASSAWYQLIDIDGKILDRVVKLKVDPKKLRLKILGNSVLGHPVSIFHRVINNEPVMYDESIKYAQDYSLWVWILQYGEISNIPEVLLYYRLSPQQITSSHRGEQNECAKIGQRSAFRLLYGFPIIDSFMDVFAAMTIEGRENVKESEARKEFCLFFNTVRVQSRNYAALIYLVYYYIFYFHQTSRKKAVQLIYDVTKTNTKLMLLSEFEYIKVGLRNKLNNVFQ